MKKLKAVMSPIDSAVRWIAKGLMFLSGGFVYIVTVVVVVDITVRFLTNKPIVGMYEAVTVCCVLLAFYGLPQVIVDKRQLHLDIVSRRFKGKGGSALGIIHAAFAVLLFGVLTYMCFKEGIYNLQQHMIFGVAVQVPYVIPWTFLAVVMTVCFFVSIRSLVLSACTPFPSPEK